MKDGIHPTYNKKVKITCACGNSVDVGSTAKSMEIEVCSACHPYYTGKHKLVDVAGRVDTFKKRLKKANVAEKKTSEVKETRIKRKKTEDKKKKDRDDVEVKLG